MISSSKKNMNLSDGRHVINVTVKDWMGNETKQSFYIRVDNTLQVRMRNQKDTNSGGLGGPGGGSGGSKGG
jgi:hypothetical protein